MRPFIKEKTFYDRGKSLSKVPNSFPYFYQSRENITHEVDRIAIGTITSPSPYAGNPMMLDVSKPPVALILGKRGTGKTVLMKTIMTELFYGNYLIVVVPDPRNEYFITKYPIQQQFYKFINPERFDSSYLSGIPTNAYAPLFFSILNNGIRPEGNESFQFDVKDANEQDWLEILGLNQSGLYAQKRAFTHIFLNTLSMSSEQMMDYIQNIMEIKIPGIQAITKDKLQATIRGMFRIGVFGSKYRIDLVKSLLNGVLVICTEGKESVDERLFWETVAMIFRKLYYLKQDDSRMKKRRLVLFHEEAWDIMPSIGEPPSKKEGIKLVRLGRLNYIAQFLNYQYFGDVPLFLKEQASVVFFNGSLSLDLQNEIMDRFNIPFDMKQELEIFPLRERGNVREWAIIREGRIERFIPYAPTTMLKLQVK